MKRLISIVAVVTISIMASAQSKIEMLFNSIDSIKDKSFLSKINYEDDSSSPQTFCRYEEISIPQSAFGNLDKTIIDTFSSEKEAYNIFRKQPGRADSTLQHEYGMKVLYGPHNSYSVTFGTQESHNYMVALFRDKKNEDKRHAFAAVWYPQDDDMVLLKYHIYGDNPSKVKKNRVISLNDNMIIDYGSTGEYMVTGYTEPAINNDMDFMKRFGTLRATMMSANSAEDNLVRTGIVMKICELFRKHSGMLTDNERNTCDKTLQELIKYYSFEDPFIKGMLEEARHELQ